MDNKTLNIVLIGVIIYLLMQRTKNNKLTNEQRLKYAEALGMAKTINGNLDVIF